MRDGWTGDGRRRRDDGWRLVGRHRHDHLGKKQWREYQERRAMIRRRNWNGYVEPGGINEWNVRLVETPDEPSGRVVLEVVDEKGSPHGNQAQNMRTVIERDGKLARVPTPEQWAFLVDIRKRRVRGEAYPI